MFSAVQSLIKAINSDAFFVGCAHYTNKPVMAGGNRRWTLVLFNETNLRFTFGQKAAF